MRARVRPVWRRKASAHAVGQDEAKELENPYAVPSGGVALFPAATANVNPCTQDKVDSKDPDRGPLLLISGEKDHTVPWASVSASHEKHERTADTALTFVPRFAQRLAGLGGRHQPPAG